MRQSAGILAEFCTSLDTTVSVHQLIFISSFCA